MTGSSPRVRSRLSDARARFRQPGIISACAEQTLELLASGEFWGDHLRVCGADRHQMTRLEQSAGSSPRVRSRRTASSTLRDTLGIISACAEQTRVPDQQFQHHRDHLRVCGADQRKAVMHLTRQGSSPRVRSRPAPRRCSSTRRRIISACAEQTRSRPTHLTPSRDHLRVCGADQSREIAWRMHFGSSPRVRSRPRIVVGLLNSHRIISACAEQTSALLKLVSGRKDHLRVCGADPLSVFTRASQTGSSPRVRSRREHL